ncbi:MAG: protein-export chaperone SecB [Alteromonadaceae bacterium]|nr:MAG: protein-export chaperone SecB [Alteromonadaceae bacterium]
MTDEQKEPEAAAADAGAQPQFSVQRIYVKDLSFESPMAVTARPQVQPQVSQDLNTQISKVTEDLYEVVLQLTVTVKLEDKVAFLTEIHQAGLFRVSGLEQARLQHMLSTVGPNIIFPYAREAIDSTVVRGGFPPLMLPPINFDAIYAQAMAEAKARAEAEGEGGEKSH